MQPVFFMIPKSRQLATAVQLQPVQSGPVSSLFAVLWTGLLNSTHTWSAPTLLISHKDALPATAFILLPKVSEEKKTNTVERCFVLLYPMRDCNNRTYQYPIRESCVSCCCLWVPSIPPGPAFFFPDRNMDLLHDGICQRSWFDAAFSMQMILSGPG